MAVFITGYGRKLVPRVPFVASFRPPRVAIECGTKLVFFGPAGDSLGFSPHGDATVDDVTLDISECPHVAVYGLFTPHFVVPVTDEVIVHSADEASGRSFEVQLRGAAHRDEMLWIQGPFPQTLDLQHATGTLRVVATGAVDKRNGAAQWRECQYTLEDVAWHKRYYAVTLSSTKRLGVAHHFAVIAQCPASRSAAMFELADRWASGLASQDWRS